MRMAKYWLFLILFFSEMSSTSAREFEGNSLGDGGGITTDNMITSDILKHAKIVMSDYRYIFELLPNGFHIDGLVENSTTGRLENYQGYQAKNFESVLSLPGHQIFELINGNLYFEEIQHLCSTGELTENTKRGWQAVDAISCGKRIKTYISRSRWVELSTFESSSSNDLNLERFFPSSNFFLSNSKSFSIGEKLYVKKIRACRKARLLVHEINVLAGREKSFQFHFTDNFVLPLLSSCRRLSIKETTDGILNFFESKNFRLFLKSDKRVSVNDIDETLGRMKRIPSSTKYYHPKDKNITKPLFCGNYKDQISTSDVFLNPDFHLLRSQIKNKILCE